MRYDNFILFHNDVFCCYVCTWMGWRWCEMLVYGVLYLIYSTYLCTVSLSTSKYYILVIFKLWLGVHRSISISECPLPTIETSSHVEWVNTTGNNSTVNYGTVLEYKCTTGYGFLSNASTHVTNTVKCEDNATISKFKECKIKGIKFS